MNETWQERFFGRVAFDGSSCWLWTGSKDGFGYGHAYVARSLDLASFAGDFGGKRYVRAHRYAYVAMRGTPASDVLMHSCDRPECVNPWHLTDATYAENSADMVAKNRQKKGEQLAHRPIRKGVAHHSAKLTEDDVRAIRRLRSAGVPHKEIGERFGCSTTASCDIARGRTWRHVA